MKAAVIILLVSSTLAAPTRTIATRQLDGLDGTGTSSGLGALISGLSSIPGLSGSSGSGFSLPSTIPGLSGLSGLSDLTGSDESGSSGLSGFKRQLTGSTKNGVTDNTGCEELTLIFARGTDELGNMGTVVGPPLATALASLTKNNVTVQGVNYDASVAGDTTLGEDGGSDIASLVKQSIKQCPDSKVVIAGYSEGAMVVHNAANSLSADQVYGAVLFGDPLKMESVGQLASSKVKEFCATGDPVCENGADVMAHLSYGSDAKEAAQFLVEAAGLSSS
ncbi:cutinase-domain-containing protein [Penicillium malachiteum]|uniref:cutinase-domain-containing protein n=1 Tax=Penicillium malachiteum TaxID=1324776 RepID=UPI002546E3D8|nr:cutinase-domain-containing protein [Penicillium malachiteum]KAJ5726641.1 cutinase-domain-containing protein [Penicillium malachiteum]